MPFVRVLLIGLGYLLLALGLFGLIVPLIPDWLLLIPALSILGHKSWVGRKVYRHLPRPLREKIFIKEVENWVQRRLMRRK